MSLQYIFYNGDKYFIELSNIRQEYHSTLKLLKINHNKTLICCNGFPFGVFLGMFCLKILMSDLLCVCVCIILSILIFYFFIIFLFVNITIVYCLLFAINLFTEEK